jgi:hypothetical protein
MKPQPQVTKSTALTFESDDQVNRILEFHLVNPYGRIVPLSAVLAHILADARAQLFNEVQRRIIGDRQIRRFPPGRTSES